MKRVCIAGAVNEAGVTLPEDAGTEFRYDASAGQYIYNLRTTGMRSGYRYRATAHIAESGQTQSVTFSVR